MERRFGVTYFNTRKGIHTNKTVDCMHAIVNGEELYAEILSEHKNAYQELKKEIIKQAAAINIPEKKLSFWLSGN